MKKLYIFILLMLIALSVGAQNIRYYKYGREVMSVNTDDVSSIESLTEAQHPLATYVSGSLLSVYPIGRNLWRATVKVSDGDENKVGFTSTPEVSTDEATWQSLNMERFDNTLYIYLPSNTDTYMQIRTLREGIPFYAEPVHIGTGYSIWDAVGDASCLSYTYVEGEAVGYTGIVLEQFYVQNESLLGEYGAWDNVVRYINTYLSTLSLSQLDIASEVEYTGGTLRLLSSIPASAIDYICSQTRKGEVIVVPNAQYEYDANMENVSQVACDESWGAPWAEYVEVIGRNMLVQTTIEYTTPILLPGQKYDLYVTMVSQGLPTWFRVGHTEMTASGSMSSMSYYENPSPITVNSDVPNADLIVTIGNSQRVFVTGTDDCERILVQQGISTPYVAPIKLTIGSIGMSSYHGKVYTRELRIAGIELVPSTEGE
ncbi:MAG: hypothetical protein IJ064_07715 [Bacteroidaceae bacterium]|nr:hypothetical protein [Bacteroidaceae bacterium]